MGKNESDFIASNSRTASSLLSNPCIMRASAVQNSFFCSATIILMGATVMTAGVLVVFYG